LFIYLFVMPYLHQHPLGPQHRHHGVVAQVEIESKILKHIVLSSAETIGAFNTGFDTVTLHRLTTGIRRSSRFAAWKTASPSGRGLHTSTFQLNVSTFCGIRWVPSVDGWVVTRHKLDTKRLTDQNGIG
jgi:hypothetical protein